ncbi:hypothetical protein DXK93_27200 [Achromobacter sp. K91]|uniref:hypothetical protein n=1 Tax=Achromobacter sp. K91 TaxID=2292262 RepID=UPI000E675EA5|nr:hypothetical protein [Achromobacter sp. K91]RIJ00251.1 hypothetical protein DXK93_27200 [Achromobacter sp. K91]
MSLTDHTPAAQAAMQEADRIAAADEYFAARTWIMDTNDNRRIFEAGFDRAYALLSKLRAPVADERAAFDDNDLLALARDNGICATDQADMYSAHKGNLVDFARAALASAPVAGEANSTSWQDALRISELPEVDEVLSNFANDSTGDNAVGLVQAILNAAPQVSEAVRDALWTLTEHNALHFGEQHNTVIQGRAALSAQPGAQKESRDAE